jgi:hypothetical protein
LASYSQQARFALANLYDRAANGDKDDAPRSTSSPPTKATGTDAGTGR